MSTRIREFWNTYDTKILTVIAVILTAVVSFQAGQTHEKQKISTNVEVSINQLASANPADEKVRILGEALERKGAGLTDLTNNNHQQNTAGISQNKECALIGSKNSDKYHLPTCTNIARIKPENQVCFTSVEDAENRGYKPAQCCHK